MKTLATIASLCLLAAPAFADIPPPGGSPMGGCSIVGGDMLTSIAGLGVFAIGWGVLSLTGRAKRK